MPSRQRGERLEKEVEIKENGSPLKVVIKKLTYGERNACLRVATKMKTNITTGQTDTDIDLYTFAEERIWRAIKSGPAGWETLNAQQRKEWIFALDPDDGDKLTKELDSMGIIKEDVEKKSTPQ